MPIINKRILVTFCGTLDKRGEVTTIGDLMAVYNVALYLTRSVGHVDIAWSGNLFDLTRYCIDVEGADQPHYDAVLYVCGPLTAGHKHFLARFHASKKIALGVSITGRGTGTLNPLDFLDAVYVRDSDLQSNFDLALADVGYPHLMASTKIRDSRVAICLAGDQAEYGADDGFDKAEDLIQQVTTNHQIVSVQTLLASTRPLPASVELDLQCSSALITTRMHGALLAIYHGVPLISIDQIRTGAKVTKMVTQLDWPVFNAWTADKFEVISELNRIKQKEISERLTHSRKLLLNRARNALEESVTFILKEL